MRRNKAISPKPKKHPTQAKAIDYGARYAFLLETCDVMRPPPLESLRTLIPTYKYWIDGVKKRAVDDFEPDSALAEGFSDFEVALERHECTVARLANSPDAGAAALARGIAEWKDKHRFTDAWIGDYALFSLGCHNANPSKPLAWCYSVSPDVTQPKISLELRQRDDEALEQFRARWERESRARMKAYLRGFQDRSGARKNMPEPAKWIAKKFIGQTFAEIAESANQEAGNVRKAVDAFCKRAEITLPAKLSRRSAA